MDSSAVSTTFLKAKIAAEDFPAYCTALNLSPMRDLNVFVGEARQYASWQAEKSPGWWNPSENMIETYYSIGKRNVVLAKMEKGILYLKSVYY